MPSRIPTIRLGVLIAALFAEDAHGSLLTIGRLAAHITYEERLAAQRDVSRFIVTQLPHDIERAVALAVVWSGALPKLFAGTPAGRRTCTTTGATARATWFTRMG